MAEQEFAGKVVVLAGGTGDLSAAIARRFGESGARVVIAGEDAEADARIPATLQADGLDVSFEPLDARNPADSDRLVKEIAAKRGRLDVWVNACEGAQPGAAETVPADAWENTVATILFGAFFCSQAAGRQMLAQGQGVIVNVASVNGTHPIEGGTARNVADAGLIMLTKTLGVEWADRGVRVVGVAAGPTPSLIASGVFTGSEHDGCRHRIPMQRLGTSDEIAEAVLFMASEEASFVVAETLRVDGGWTAYQLF